MASVIIRERYKVTRVLEQADDYACIEAVDIIERERPTRLLNVYQGQWPTVYARIFAQFSNCPAFCEAFLEEGDLVAVFAPCGGTEIDRIFDRGAVVSWRDRLELAESLLHRALELTDLPPAVGCAALSPDNVRIAEGNRVSLRFCLRPMPDRDARALALCAAGQVRKMLSPRFEQADAEYRFYCSLTRDCFASIIPLYACWHRMEPEIRAEYEALDAQNARRRWLTCLAGQIRRWLREKRR